MKSSNGNPMNIKYDRTKRKICTRVNEDPEFEVTIAKVDPREVSVVKVEYQVVVAIGVDISNTGTTELEGSDRGTGKAIARETIAERGYKLGMETEVKKEEE